MSAASPAPVSPEAALLRAVGAFALTFSVVNVIIGGGIFMMPGSLAGTLGAGAPWALLFGALVIVPITLCMAAAGSRVGVTGGPYAYAHAAFGPFAGFAAGSLMWISNAASSAGVASALAGQVGTLVPALQDPTARALFLVAVYGVLIGLNLAGIRAGARSIVVLTTLKLAPLVLLCVLGVWWVDWSRIEWWPLPDASSLGASMVLVMFAYSGMETALVPAGEVKSTHRTVPRAALTAIALVVVVYFLLQIVATGVLGASTLAQSNAPLAAAAGALWAPGLVLLVLTASVSMLGFLQGNVLGTSRLVYALARDGWLPQPLARITPRTRVPAGAILLHAGVALLLALGGSFTELALISGGAICLTYVLSCAAAWRLQQRDVASGGAPFRLPGGALIPLLSLALLVWVLTTLKAEEWTAIGIALAVIGVVYALLAARRR